MAMDTALMRALARKETLENEIADRQAELREIDTFVTLYQRFAGAEETLVTSTMPIQIETSMGESRAAESQPDIGSAKPRGISQDEFNQVAPQILLEHGKPARRGEFLQLFHDRNIPIGGTNEMLNFGTKIWKAREFLINLPKVGYWPKDRPYPPADYEPGNSLPLLKESDDLEHTAGLRPESPNMPPTSRWSPLIPSGN
jgi:hypothetical protein